MFVFGRSQNAPTDMEGASIELRNTHNLVGAIHESPEIVLQNSHNLVGARIARPKMMALPLVIGVLSLQFYIIGSPIANKSSFVFGRPNATQAVAPTDKKG